MFTVEMLHFPFVTKKTTCNITKYININPTQPHHKVLTKPQLSGGYGCLTINFKCLGYDAVKSVLEFIRVACVKRKTEPDGFPPDRPTYTVLQYRPAVLNLWVATPAGVALGFQRGRWNPHEFVKK